MAEIDSEIMWATSTTGEDFQCVHVDFAREQQAEIDRLRRGIPCLISVIQALYKSEINCSISSFWDAGWNVRLGDEMNGWGAEADFANDKLDDAAEWLIREAKRAWPKSEFAKQW